MKTVKQRKATRSRGDTDQESKRLDLLTATRGGDVDRVLQILKDKKINVNARDDLHPNKVRRNLITNEK